MPHMKTTKVVTKPLEEENQKGIVVGTFVQIKTTLAFHIKHI